MSHQSSTHRYLLSKQIDGQNVRFLDVNTQPLVPLNQQLQTKNIFQDQNIGIDKNKVMDLGPLFDKSGTVVRRSIIGLSEEFKRQLGRLQQSHESSKLNQGEKSKRKLSRQAYENTKLLTDEKESYPKILVSPSISNLQSNMAIINLIKNQQTNFSSPAPSVVVPFRSNKKLKTQLISFTKQNLLQQMIGREEQMDINRIKEDYIISSQGPTSERIYTRDHRVQSKFTEQAEGWDNTAIELGLKSGRQANETLFQRSLQYREKVEHLMGIQATNEQSTKVQSSYWYGDLRNYRSPKSDRAPFSLHLHSTKQRENMNIKTERSESINRYIHDQEHEGKAFVQPNYNSKFQTNYVLFPNKQVEIIRSGYSKSIQALGPQKNKLYPINFAPEINDKGKLRFRQIQNDTSGLKELKLDGVNLFKKEFEGLRDNGLQSSQRYNHFRVADDPLVDYDDIIAEDKCSPVLERRRKFIDNKKYDNLKLL